MRPLALLLLLSGLCRAAISVVQAVDDNVTNAATLNVVLGSGASASNVLLVSFSRNATGTPSSVSGACDVSWSELINSAVNRYVSIWCCSSPTASATTVTGTWGGKSGTRGHMIEVSGLNGCTGDGTDANNGTATTIPAGPVTTTNADDLLFAAGVWAGTYSSGPTDSFTDIGDGAFANGRAAYRIVSSTASYSTSWTQGTSNPYDAVFAAIKGAAAGTVVKDPIMRGIIARPR